MCSSDLHQAEFLVLKETAMPSVLIELGFISNPEEEKYLNTDNGLNNLANGIYHAFLTYKREHEIRLTGSSQTIIPKETESSNHPITKQPTIDNKSTSNSQGDIIFKIQLLAAASPIKAGDKQFKGLQNIDHYKEEGMYKYTYGASTDYNKVIQTQRSIKDKFNGAFIIAFKDGKKININEAIAEFKKKQNKK